ncbi:CHAP domain-containing protein [bacterium]|nr:CHAP domain-containing protein [bacterium]
MHFTDFIAKYQGKKIDYDGAYGAQCVDLFRFYCKEVLGINQPKGVTGAKDLWTNYLTDPNLYNNFERIVNTPDFVPQPGDVWIWTANYGKYGHVAIESYATATISKFQCFSQNDPSESACVLKDYAYKYVYGVLRPKNQANIRITNYGSKTEIEDKMIDWSWFNKSEVNSWETLKPLLFEYLGEKEGRCAYGDPETVNHGHLGDERAKSKKLETQIAELQKQVDVFDQTISEKNKTIDSLQAQVQQLKTQMQGMTVYHTQAEWDRLHELLDVQGVEIKDLEQELDQKVKLTEEKNKTIDALQARVDSLKKTNGGALWELLVARLKELLS